MNYIKTQVIFNMQTELLKANNKIHACSYWPTKFLNKSSTAQNMTKNILSSVKQLLLRITI